MAFHPILLLSTALLLLFPQSNSAQNIPVGTTLTASQNSIPWRSSNGDFAFGFQHLPNSTNQFILSIWFDKIPAKTSVWYERSSYPVARGSTLRLDATDGLILEDPQGRNVYNTTQGGLVNQVSHAVMNDTGNFVISRSDSSILWESFRHPADTILLTQTIEIGDMLISKKTEADFSMGRFYASINDDGNFVFNTKSQPSNSGFDSEYYSSSTSTSNASESGVQVLFSDKALISVVRRNGDQQILSPVSIPLPSENYYRATLGFDGLFTQYYHAKNFGNDPQWLVADSWPNDICGVVGSGACGHNSVCRIQSQRPVCECPRGFSLADPTNPYGDCRPLFAQSCIDENDTQDEFDMENVTDVDWPLNDYENIRPSTEAQCRSACLSDCFCGVSIFRSNNCWKKRLPLSNGRVDTSLNVIAFLKFKKSDPTHTNSGRPRRDHNTTLILLGSSSFINLLLISAVCLLFFLIYNRKKVLARDGSSGPSLRCFSYKELAQATKGFGEELGRGAFGIVYKGVMSLPIDSSCIIAVKKLNDVLQDSEREFRTEVNAIGKTHHKNLVSLIGFCEEGFNRLLVYEYMSNGTLAGFLFGDLKPGWSLRTQIAMGIARGLAYLHEECSTQIIHCDIKPQNILLDESYTARIADFGLAKLLAMNQSKTQTNIRGTKGYVAPEWFRNKQITAKVDVYSFGVVLLEIVTCRKIVEDLEAGEGENPILTDWAWDCFFERRLDALVKDDGEALRDWKMVERFLLVGLWCIQEDASLRPTMRKASQMLEGIVEVPVPPYPPSFISVGTRIS